jgi:glycosyltransferase involved in cell wall biosynthesis
MAIRVLYISYDGMTDPLGQSQVIPYLAGLSAKGYRFALISCEKKEAFAKNEKTIREILERHHIEWHPLTYTKSPPVLSTLYDVWKIRRLAFALNKRDPFSIVHCRSYIAALAGLAMKKKFGTKFIFDMRGLWADERVDGKLWNLGNPVFKSVYRFFKKKEREFLHTADYTISLTQHAKEEILSWNDASNTKIEVIPCCADLHVFDRKQVREETLNALRSELQLSCSDYVLLYLGSIGTWYMLDEMMEFFSVLKQKKAEAKFLFVTKDEHERILRTAEKYKVKDAVRIRPASRSEVPGLVALSKYSIFFILPSYSKKASSPTKQGEIMAMGLPVVCNSGIGDTDRIVNACHSGILVDAFTEAAYEKAVRQMESAFDPEAIAAGANDFFSLESGVEKYAAVYHAVVAG